MAVKVLSIHYTTPDADKSGVPMVYRDIAKALVQAVKDNVKMNIAFTILPGNSVGFYPPALVVRSKVTDATAPIWYGEIAIQGCGWTIWNNNL